MRFVWCLFIRQKFFWTHLSCDVTHWRVAQAILLSHSLFSHFNYVFSLPLFDPLTVFSNFKIILFVFVFVFFSFAFLLRQYGFCVFFFWLLRPSFNHVALTELMFVQIVLVERTLVWAMFPTVSCLPLTLVLSLFGVASATFFGFPPRRCFGEGHI